MARLRWHEVGTISCLMRERFLVRLEVGGGKGWPRVQGLCIGFAWPAEGRS
jgi:hypothetical protein